MNQLYTILISHFTEAIAYNLALGAMFWAMLFFTRKYTPRNAKLNYNIGLFMQSILVINFVYLLIRNNPTQIGSFQFVNSNNNFNTNNYLSIIYIVLLLLKFVKLYFQNKEQFTTISLESEALSQLKNWLTNQKAHFGIHRNIQIQISEKLKSPFTKGIWKPIIVLPLAAINNLSSYQMEAILLHELTHIKRFDFLWNAIQLLIETILYFNPFVYWIGKMIREDRELICDNNVVINGYNSVEYVKSLLFFTKEKGIKKSDLRALNITGNQPSEFYNRVSYLLGKESKRKNRWSIPAFILGAIGILALSKSNIQMTNYPANKPFAAQVITLTDGNNNIQKFYVEKINNTSYNIENQTINSTNINTKVKPIDSYYHRPTASKPKLKVEPIEKNKSLHLESPLNTNSNFSLARYLPNENSNIKIFKKVLSEDKIVYQIDYQNVSNKNALINQIIHAFAQQNTIMGSSVSNIYYARNNVVEEQKIIELNTAENNYVFVSTTSSLQILVSKQSLNNIN